MHQNQIGHFLLGLFFAGAVAAATELFLLEHYEELWQQAPLVCLGLGLGAGAWHAARRGAGSLRVFVISLGLMIACGLIGLVLHYRGNLEFELEMHPGATGLTLFWGAIRGATPALAPGTMVYLGLLGLVYAYVARKRLHTEANRHD